jgi:Tol biopolymer transport system component
MVYRLVGLVEVYRQEGVMIRSSLRTQVAATSDRIWPLWSPDGRWLLYQSNDGQTAGWWLVSATGGAPRLLGAYGGVSW